MIVYFLWKTAVRKTKNKLEVLCSAQKWIWDNFAPYLFKFFIARLSHKRRRELHVQTCSVLSTILDIANKVTRSQRLENFAEALCCIFTEKKQNMVFLFDQYSSRISYILQFFSMDSGLVFYYKSLAWLHNNFN